MAATLYRVQYDTCDGLVAFEPAWWLLMAWRLFGTRTSATILFTAHGRHISGVLKVMVIIFKSTRALN